MSSILQPLYELLHKDVRWQWTEHRQRVFKKIKDLMASAQVLVPYDPNLKLKLSCDASPYGVGCILSHILPTGEERPIAYASKTLTETQKRYSVLDKESLAIIFGIKRFHQYLFLRHFILVTDHKPLIYNFKPDKEIPSMASGRLQRWCLFLSAYDYEIRFVRSKENINADALSRLPLAEMEEHDTDEVLWQDNCIGFIEQNTPILSNYEVKKNTAKDPILSKVFNYVLTGWPEQCQDEALKPYFNRKQEIYIEGQCLLWGYRLIVPQKLQVAILNELHSSHLGIVKTKSLARSYVWWPGLDVDIESTVKGCVYCNKNKEDPPRVKLHSWPWPDGPVKRIHADFLEYKSQMMLIILDAYSKWLDIKMVRSTQAQATIDVFRDYFATWGLPLQLVTDNGPPWTSLEFRKFLSYNSVHHCCHF